MSTKVEQVFGRTLQKTEQWLADLAKALGTDDLELVRRTLRATLHLLRDRLTPEEAVDLAAQLPMLLRGLYYEGWTPRKTPHTWSRDDFLEEVRWLALDGNPRADPEAIVRAVLHVLETHVSAGEMQDVKRMLPQSFASLFEA